MEGRFRIYSVWDSAACKYGPLFEAVADSVATRNYLQICESIPKRFRHEFKLYFIGEFDYNTGIFEQFEKPKELVVSFEEMPELPQKTLKVMEK